MSEAGTADYEAPVIGRAVATAGALWAVGGIVGLLAFTRLLNYVLKRHHDLTVSVLIGLIIASLYGLWPFRTYAMAGEVRVNLAHILPQANINLAITVLAFLIGCGVVLLFYRLESQRN